MLVTKDKEQAVLSAILVDPDCIRVIAPELDVDDFEYPKDRILWACCLDLYSKQKKIGAVAVLDWLRHHKKDQDVEKEYVVSIRDFLSGMGEDSTAGVIEWARDVKEASGRRKLLRTCGDVLDRVRSSTESLDEVHARTLESIMNCRKVEKQGFREIGAYESELIEDSDKWFNGVNTAIPTGFHGFDKMLGGGLFEKRLIILGGRPGMMKTAFVCAIARNVAAWLDKNKKPGVVAIASLEMSARDLYLRMACEAGKIDSQALVSGELKGRLDIQQRLHTELEKLKALPLWIDDTEDMTSSLLHYKVALMHAIRGVALLIVDFVELMQDKSDGEELRVSGVFRAGKAIAKTLGIPVILLSQLNRDVEKTENKVPTTWNLRYGGSGEAVADQIWLCYDPYKYSEMGVKVIPPEKMVVNKEAWYLIIPKARYSKLGFVPFKVEREFLSFSDPFTPLGHKEEF